MRHQPSHIGTLKSLNSSSSIGYTSNRRQKKAPILRGEPAESQDGEGEADSRASSDGCAAPAPRMENSATVPGFNPYWPPHGRAVLQDQVWGAPGRRPEESGRGRHECLRRTGHAS